MQNENFSNAIKNFLTELSGVKTSIPKHNYSLYKRLISIC